MIAFAPGKLVLTGAYAVLGGAPAVVMAVSRGAWADTERQAASATPEVRAALGDGPAPYFDAASMFTAGRKLGLGASAAILVASLAAREAESGADLGGEGVRAEIFRRARAAHARAQAGGSGVDVAASVYGGVLEYVPGSPVRAALPALTRVRAFACEASARTAELRAEIDRFARRSPQEHLACMQELDAIARQGAGAVRAGSHEELVSAVRRAARGLDRLGRAAGVPIVPPGFEGLEQAAQAEGAAFCVSGAGGGDVAAFVGSAPPSASFRERARRLGVFEIDVALDEKGVRVIAQPPALGAGAAGKASPS